MRSLRLHDGDIVFDSVNAMQMIESESEFIQSIKLLIQTSLGDWFLNANMGMDYEPLKCKGFDEDLIRFALIDCLQQDDDFSELTRFDFKMVGRVAYIDFSARFGEIEVELSLGQGV